MHDLLVCYFVWSLIVILYFCFSQVIQLRIQPFQLFLPFTGDHGLQIRNQLTKLFNQPFPHIELNVVFRPTCRIKKLFLFQRQISQEHKI